MDSLRDAFNKAMPQTIEATKADKKAFYRRLDELKDLVYDVFKKRPDVIYWAKETDNINKIARDPKEFQRVAMAIKFAPINENAWVEAVKALNL